MPRKVAEQKERFRGVLTITCLKISKYHHPQHEPHPHQGLLSSLNVTQLRCHFSPVFGSQISSGDIQGERLIK